MDLHPGGHPVGRVLLQPPAVPGPPALRLRVHRTSRVDLRLPLDRRGDRGRVGHEREAQVLPGHAYPSRARGAAAGPLVGGVVLVAGRRVGARGGRAAMAGGRRPLTPRLAPRRRRRSPSGPWRGARPARGRALPVLGERGGARRTSRAAQGRPGQGKAGQPRVGAVESGTGREGRLGERRGLGTEPGAPAPSHPSFRSPKGLSFPPPPSSSVCGSLLFSSGLRLPFPPPVLLGSRPSRTRDALHPLSNGPFLTCNCRLSFKSDLSSLTHSFPPSDPTLRVFPGRSHWKCRGIGNDSWKVSETRVTAGITLPPCVKWKGSGGGALKESGRVGRPGVSNEECRPQPRDCERKWIKNKPNQTATTLFQSVWWNGSRLFHSPLNSKLSI